MDDGRLLDYLMNHDELMEEKVAFYIRDTMEALQYLHNCRVAHLDIKVGRKENDAILFSNLVQRAPSCTDREEVQSVPQRDDHGMDKHYLSDLWTRERTS